MSGPAIKSQPNQGRNSLQDGKFRTSCCPWIVVTFWYQFVFHNATAGLVKYIFKSSNRAKWRTGTRKLARFTNKPTQKQKEGRQSSIGRPIARPSILVWGVHRKSRRHRCACKRTHFSWLWFGTAHKSGTQEAFTLTSRKTEIAKCASEPRWQRGPCRRRTGEAVPRAEKFGDLITADHKVPKEEGESRNNHRYAVVEQDLATRWIQSYPCKTKTSQQTERSPRKFLVRKAESRLRWQFFGFLANLVKIYHGIIEWYCWKSGTQSKRRNVCCIVAIGLGWIMVGWYYGMLLPSATCPRPPGRLKNSFWKTIWRTTSRPSDSFLVQWLNIIRFLHETSQGSTNLPRKFYLEYSSDMHLSRGEFGKEILWLQTLRNWRTWTRQKIHIWKINAKEVWRHKGTIFDIPSNTWKRKIVRKRPRIPRNHSKAETTRRDWGFQWGNFKANGKSLNWQNQEMRLKLVQGDFIYRHHIELRVPMCRRKKHSLFHWKTLTWPELPIQIWTRCKNNVLIIVGIWTRIEVCQILGKDSQGSFYWKKNLPRDICGPGRRRTKIQATTRPEN